MASGCNDNECTTKEEGKEVVVRGEKKLGKIADFFPTLTLIFFLLNACNSLLFLKGERDTLSLLGTNLGLDSNRKDSNRCFKVAIMKNQILTVKSYLSWPFWGVAAAAVVLISQKEPYRGVVKCQAILVVFVLSNLVKRRSIKWT